MLIGRWIDQLLAHFQLPECECRRCCSMRLGDNALLQQLRSTEARVAGLADSKFARRSLLVALRLLGESVAFT